MIHDIAATITHDFKLGDRCMDGWMDGWQYIYTYIVCVELNNDNDNDNLVRQLTYAIASMIGKRKKIPADDVFSKTTPVRRDETEIERERGRDGGREAGC